MSLIPTSTKEGYTFIGWFDNEGNLFDFENTKITDNITLNAHWLKISAPEILDTFNTTDKGDVKATINIESFGHDVIFEESSDLISISEDGIISYLGDFSSLGEEIVITGKVLVNSTTYVTSTIKITIDNSGLVFSLEEGYYSLTSSDNSKVLNKLIVPSTYKGVSVIKIKENSFTSLESISFSNINHITTISSLAFNGCSFTEFILPKEVNSLGSSVFANCSKLTTFIFEDGINLLSLPENTFNGASSLTYFTLPSCIKSIGTNAFYNTKLDSFTFIDTSSTWSRYDLSITDFRPKFSSKDNANFILNNSDCVLNKNIMVEGIVINHDELEIKMGEEDTLEAHSTNKDATFSHLFNWTSSDTKICSVDEFGQLIAHKMGNVTITVTAIDGSYKSATCAVRVYATATYVFDNGGTDAIEKIYASSPYAPIKETPTKENSVFINWYKNDSTVYDFSEVVTDNISIVAHWLTLASGISLNILDTFNKTNSSDVINNLKVECKHQVTLSSSDKSIATVDNVGKVTYQDNFDVLFKEVTITACAEGKSMNIVLIVTNSGLNFESLSSSSYKVIYSDEVIDLIIPSKIIVNSTLYDVKEIGSYDSIINTKLSYVFIPSSIEKINIDAFKNCTFLDSVIFSDYSQTWTKDNGEAKVTDFVFDSENPKNNASELTNNSSYSYTKNIMITSINITSEKEIITTTDSDPFTITYEVLPSDATYANDIEFIYDHDVISYDPLSKTFKALKAMENPTTITLKAKDGSGASDSINVLIKPLFILDFNNETGKRDRRVVDYGSVIKKPSKPPIYDGHIFIDWYLNGEPYDFSQSVTSDITLLAMWEVGYQINISSNDSSMGRINGVSKLYKEGENIELTATANAGYIFDKWVIDGEVIETKNPFTYIVEAKAANIVAYFKSE